MHSQWKPESPHLRPADAVFLVVGLFLVPLAESKHFHIICICIPLFVKLALFRSQQYSQLKDIDLNFLQRLDSYSERNIIVNYT